ncbi:glycosyltransferase [Chitinophaga lutea]|nr:glycosyltransferase [Chitinophaga lutea]
MELVKILHRHYELHLVIITAEKVDSNSVEFITDHSTSYKIFRLGKLSAVLNTWRALLNGHPLQVSYFYMRQVQRYINTLKNEIDFAICNMVRTATYLQTMKKPVFFDIVDSYALSYDDAYRKTNSLIYKVIYKIEAGRLKRFEQAIIKNTEKTFFVNKFEADYWKNAGPTIWNPNGVTIPNHSESLAIESNKYGGKFIAFLGKMDYQPNIDAINWFIQRVFPYLNKDISLVILGTSPKIDLLKMASKEARIIVTGFIENPYAIMKHALAIIAPMQTGSGIQNKILEGMSLSKIVVCTSLAARPIIGAQHNKHLIIEDEPSKMGDLINQISLHPAQYVIIGENARKLVSSNFSWQNHENILIKEIEDTINANTIS